MKRTYAVIMAGATVFAFIFYVGSLLVASFFTYPYRPF